MSRDWVGAIGEGLTVVACLLLFAMLLGLFVAAWQASR